MVRNLPFAKRWKDNYRFADHPPIIGRGTSVLCSSPTSRQFTSGRTTIPQLSEDSIRQRGTLRERLLNDRRVAIGILPKSEEIPIDDGRPLVVSA